MAIRIVLRGRITVLMRTYSDSQCSICIVSFTQNEVVCPSTFVHHVESLNLSSTTDDFQFPYDAIGECVESIQKTVFP